MLRILRFQVRGKQQTVSFSKLGWFLQFRMGALDIETAYCQVYPLRCVDPICKACISTMQSLIESLHLKLLPDVLSCVGTLVRRKLTAGLLCQVVKSMEGVGKLRECSKSHA